MAPVVARWAIVWKNLDTGKDGIGEGLFLNKEEALEFAQLVGRPDAAEHGANIVFDAEQVWIDPDKPLVGQMMSQLARQQQERRAREPRRGP